MVMTAALMMFTVGQAAVVINPFEAGNIGAYFPLENAFDSPPDQPPTVNGGVISGYTDGGSDAPYYTDRFGYIDFGENYSIIRITATWTGYRTWSATHSPTPYDNLFWSDSISTNTAGTTPETNINWLTAPTVSGQNAILWYQDWAAADESEHITPASRYLILHSPDPMSNRAIEYAILGYYNIPEPSGLALLLFGVAALSAFRARIMTGV